MQHYADLATRPPRRWIDALGGRAIDKDSVLKLSAFIDPGRRRLAKFVQHSAGGVLVAVGLMSFVLGGFAAMSTPALAGAKTSPAEGRAYVSKFGDRFVAAYRSDGVSKQQRRTLIGRVILEAMDFRTISDAVLQASTGNAGASDRREFNRLFTAFFIDQMLEEIGDLDVTGFSIDEMESMPDGDLVVETDVQLADGDTQSSGWRIRNVAGDLKIVDMLMHGVSVSMHFSGKLERRGRGSIERINEFLRQQTSGSHLLTLVQQVALNL